MVVAEVQPGFELTLSSRANLQVVWVPRTDPNAVTGEFLLGALDDLPIMKEGCFAWAATETQAVRAIRRYLVEGRGFDKRWVKAAGLLAARGGGRARRRRRLIASMTRSTSVTEMKPALRLRS